MGYIEKILEELKNVERDSGAPEPKNITNPWRLFQRVGELAGALAEANYGSLSWYERLELVLVRLGAQVAYLHGCAAAALRPAAAKNQLIHPVTGPESEKPLTLEALAKSHADALKLAGQGAPDDAE